MANVLLTLTDITREAVAVLHEQLQLAKHAVRKYEDRFGKNGSKGQIGTSVAIRKPPRYLVGKLASISGLSGDSAEDSVTLNATIRRNVRLSFNSQDLSLSVTDFSRQFLRPAISRLAREIDLVGFALCKYAPQTRVTHDVTTAIAFIDYVTVNARLTQQLAREDERKLFAEAVTHAIVVDANKGLFQSSTEVEDQYLKGYMGISGGFTWISSQNVSSIAFPAVPAQALGTLSAIGVEAAQLIAVTGGTANGVIMNGQGFTVAGCYAIDPETQANLPYLKTFIAYAPATDSITGTGTEIAVTLNGSGVGNIPIADKLYTVGTSGPTLANISSLPASGAAATRTETGTIGASTTAPIAFGIQSDAMALAVIGLEVPGGVDIGASESFENIGLRIVRQYDVVSDIWNCRVDIQFGWAILRPELIASIVGKAG